MNRRDFLHKTSLAGTALYLSPYAFSKELLKANYKGKVAIIGAGAAGLYAGYLLEHYGVEFDILEASDHYGGRIGKNTGFADFPIDIGAQWIHGKRSLLKPLVKQSGVKVHKDNSDVFYWFNDQFVDDLPQDPYDMLEGDNSFPDMSFLDYANSIGLGEEYRYVVEQIAGDQGADADLLSVRWNAVEEENWHSGKFDYKFEETFYDLLDKSIVPYVKQKIHLNTVVKSINYSGEKIELVDASGNSLVYDKVIVTVPITVLQDGDIEFIPAIPVHQQEAFKKIGMGPGMKVFLRFKETFYHPNIVGGKVCAAYADEKEGKDGDDHVLLAFLMGHQAQALSNLKDHEAVAKALLEELDEMYQGKASQLFIDALVCDWTTEPFIRGAYSYSKVGIGGARQIAAQPLGNKVLFAGEAMNLNGHHQTVHGAMEAGRECVEAILPMLET